MCAVPRACQILAQNVHTAYMLHAGLSAVADNPTRLEPVSPDKCVSSFHLTWGGARCWDELVGCLILRPKAMGTPEIMS